MSATRNVADVLGRKLFDGRARKLDGYGEFDPALLFSFLLAALDRLLLCRPDPDDGWEYLAWTPAWGLGLFGLRLARHRAKVRDRLAESADQVKARVFCDLVWRAVDDGDVGAHNLRDLYAERRGTR